MEPIAIVGRACVLPGAQTPNELWELIHHGQVVIGAVPPGRWRLDTQKSVSLKSGVLACDYGGYVTEFADQYNSTSIPDLHRLDPIVHWLLACGHRTLSDAGLQRAPERSAFIIGNLSYPSESHTQFVEEFWLAKQRGETAANIDPRNRFSSGLPIAMVARELGVNGPSFAIDAACASSLYAIKLACDRLMDGEVDLALAGGINRADDLIIHLGFSALQALSPSGRSRPFHCYADGLVPGEGAALVALKRLGDALRDGNTIHGIIRGIGLSNDGREGGFLLPGKAGQLRAMHAAYKQAGMVPSDVPLVECHATGTARGDAIELESLAELYGTTGPKPVISSLKANIGHTITTSGAASLIKILAAFDAGLMPPTPSCDEPSPLIEQYGFHLPQSAQSWPEAAPPRAAISNFGFGGNNAHLIVEAWGGRTPARRNSRVRKKPPADVVITALGVNAAETHGLKAFTQALFSASPDTTQPASEIHLKISNIGIPPHDLRASLAQQTSVLEAATEALGQIGQLDTERTGVFVGIGCDTNTARHALPLRMLELDVAADLDIKAWQFANRDSLPEITSQRVIGVMANVPANRLHSQQDWHAPGFTVSSEELSGIDALHIAARALRSGELDAALVAASDFSVEPAHQTAASSVLPEDRRLPGDATVALVLMRQEDALAQGYPIWARVEEVPPNGEPCKQLSLLTEIGKSEITARFGHAHACSGLLHLAAGVVCAATGVRIDKHGAWPSLRAAEQILQLKVDSFSGRTDTLGLQKDRAGEFVLPIPGAKLPHFRHYAADSLNALQQSVEADEEQLEGDLRLAIIAETEANLEHLRSNTLEQLQAGKEPQGPGIYFGKGKQDGEIGHCFTGAAAAYPGAGRQLLLAFPEIAQRLAERFDGTEALGQKLYGADVTSYNPEMLLAGCALVCQAHALLTQEFLAIPAQAAIGLSSGETNALLAFGVWRDLDAMLAQIDRSGLYGEQLTGTCHAAASHWQLSAEERVTWRCWRLAAPVAKVKEALNGESRAYLTIIHHPEDCVIGGDEEACDRVIDKVGRSRAIELGLDMIVHCPPLKPFASKWHAIHQRNTHPVDDVRFYTHAGCRSYLPTSEAAADAITRQALETVDFPRTILQAYDDGVRIFIEHGPRAILTGAIKRILEGRPHVAVALDRSEPGTLTALCHALTQLWAAGVPMKLERLRERLRALAAAAELESGSISETFCLSAHPPDVVWPAKAEQTALNDNQPISVMTPPLPECLDYDIRSLFGPVATDRKEHVTSSGVAATQTSNHPLVQLMADISAQHQAFLQTQKEMHEHFLDHRRRALSQLEIGEETPKFSTVTLKKKPIPPTPITTTKQPTCFNRPELEVHASGRISTLFGPIFAQQDNYPRQVRMPAPPFLLVDRVTSLEAEAGQMRTGRVVSETNVKRDAWYLQHNRMCCGLVVEAGHADLLLVSYIGADFLNQGERVYRLLGCELTFFGDLPEVGDTLRYEIEIDSHAKTGEVRIFFFHYDCYLGDRLLLSVRNGQAGFFTDRELATSGGVLWEAERDEPKQDARLDPPPKVSHKRSFSSAELDAWRNGDSYTCFGDGFEAAASHLRTPTIPSGRMKLLDEVVIFDPLGGPWKRGYLKARMEVPVDAWFYSAHFKNDPCMPGTLMADAAIQALATTMAAHGFTLNRDSWRFVPVYNETAKFVCRGQVTPDSSHILEYEIFIEEVIDGDRPQLFAALICRSDGFKVFGCRRFGIQLVPD
jgi:PfaB family protein